LSYIVWSLTSEDLRYRICFNLKKTGYGENIMY
jgi:hypothetical protein